MNTIREVFDQTRPINRQITSVINYSGAAEDQLEREIREYEVTDSLARHYRIASQFWLPEACRCLSEMLPSIDARKETDGQGGTK